MRHDQCEDMAKQRSASPTAGPFVAATVVGLLPVALLPSEVALGEV